MHGHLNVKKHEIFSCLFTALIIKGVTGFWHCLFYTSCRIQNKIIKQRYHMYELNKYLKTLARPKYVKSTVELKIIQGVL